MKYFSGRPFGEKSNVTNQNIVLELISTGEIT